MRGRHRKNPKLKILHGEAAGKPPPGPPKPLGGIPAPYEWMTEDAKREWERVAPQLHARGLLTVLDQSSLACYCECFATYISMKRVVEKEGATYEHRGLVKRHPCVAIRDQAARDLAMFARELGLVPTARQRLGADDDPGEADELATFLNDSKGGAPSA